MEILKLLFALFLLILATVLVFIIGSFPFIIALFTLGKLDKYSNYFRDLALSVDQLGNVIASPLFNFLLIDSDGYKFGNIDETVSSALGKNNKRGTLNRLGKLLDAILNCLDKDHSLNSIELNP